MADAKIGRFRVAMDRPCQAEPVIAHSVLMADSYRRATGRELLPAGSDPAELARRLFEAPFVLVAHGVEADPLLNYGNAAALRLWEMTWDQLVGTPSRLTAEAPERAERERLLAAVTAHGFIDNYAGIRISRSGRRFRIERATVWNLVDQNGSRLGQAATFAHWEFLAHDPSRAPAAPGNT